MRVSLTARASVSILPAIVLLVASVSPAADDPFDQLVQRIGSIDGTSQADTWNESQLPAQLDEAAVEHRRQMILRFLAADPWWSPKRKNPKYQHPLAACRLKLDPTDREALDYVRYSLGHRGKDDDFGYSTLAGLLRRFERTWDKELVEAIRRDVISYEGFLRGGTENHIAMRRTSGYLFGERFPDETFHHDLSGRQLSEVCLKYMRDYGHSLYATSQVEYLSPAYLGVNAAAWLNVAELAVDDRARLCGRAVLDWLFADLAVNLCQGVIIPPLQREKGLLLERYPMSYARSQVQFITWMYFGTGNTPWSNDTFDDPKYAPGFPHSLCVGQFAASGWRPHPVLANIASGGVALPYMLWQARGNWPCIEEASLNPYGKTQSSSSHKYVADPRYQLRSVYRSRHYAIGTGNFKENMGDPLLRTAVPFGVIWQSRDDRNYLLAAHPFWYTKRKWQDSDEPLGDEDWMGISPFCQTVHWENAAILLYDLPARDPYQGAAAKGSPLFLSERGDDVAQAAYIYVPDSVDERTRSDGVFCFREGDVYVALRPFCQHAEWEPSRHEGYVRLAMRGSLVGCAIEVGDRSEYGSFPDFQTKVAAARLDTTRLASNKEVHYRSTRGHQLRLRHTSVGWLPEASVNGVPLDFDRWPTCESPYVKCRDRVLDVNDGRKGLSIDWRGDDPAYTYYDIRGTQRKVIRREFIEQGKLTTIDAPR